MIFTDYYKGEKLTAAKCRYDVTTSTGHYDFFESLFDNSFKLYYIEDFEILKNQMLIL